MIPNLYKSKDTVLAERPQARFSAYFDSVLTGELLIG